MKNKSEKGITLIALIITIIVLLILAGVTISAINGNENVMEKAKQAKEDSEKGEDLEAIKMSVISSIVNGNTGKVNLDDLKTELKKIPSIVEETEVDALSGKAPWTITAKSGRKYDITEGGEVLDSTPKVAGLYNDDGYTSWEELKTNGVIYEKKKY